jgi:hypothetical protein
MNNMEFRAIVYREDDGRWTARCLDLDFFGESESADGAIENLVLAMIAELRFASKDGRAPFQDLPKPPAGFLAWAATERTKQRAKRDIPVPQDLASRFHEAWTLLALEPVQATA